MQATTRTSAKRDVLLSHGAQHVIATQEQDLVEEVKRITGGKGARVTFDPVAGPFLAKLADAAAPGVQDDPHPIALVKTDLAEVVARSQAP